MSRSADYNPFSPEIPPHRPDDIYNPHPFPLSPTEGNPWQPSQPYVPPPPGSMRMPEPEINGVPLSHSHGGSWDTSGDSGDLSTVTMGGHRQDNTSYMQPYAAQETPWRETENAWDGPYTVDTPASPPPVRQSPYRFAGTRYANTEDGSQAVTDDNIVDPPIVQPVEAPAPKKTIWKPYMGGARQRPSKKRLWLRLTQCIAAIGSFGFQAGASPFSGYSIPSDFDLAAYYLVYVVAVLTVLLSFFHIYIYLWRRYGRGEKVKRIILIFIDLIMAILWGAGVIAEILNNHCSPGGYSHWCDFYNISLFWGSLDFVLFLLAFGWDVVGACSGKRMKEAVV